MSIQRKERSILENTNEMKATASTSLPSNVGTFNIDNAAEHARLRRVGVKRVSQQSLLDFKTTFLQAV